MGSDKVVNNLVNVQGALQTFPAFGIGIRPPSEGTVAPPQRGILRLNMVGVNGRFRQVLPGIRVLPVGCFLFGSFVFRGGVL